MSAGTAEHYKCLFLQAKRRLGKEDVLLLICFCWFAGSGYVTQDQQVLGTPAWNVLTECVAREFFQERRVPIAQSPPPNGAVHCGKLEWLHSFFRPANP